MTAATRDSAVSPELVDSGREEVHDGLLSYAEVARVPPEQIGYKAWRVAALAVNGMPVPPGLVLTHQRLIQVLGGSPMVTEVRQLLNEIALQRVPIEVLKERCDRIDGLVAATALPSSVARPWLKALQATCSGQRGMLERVIVRSSSFVEDSLQGAGAGVFKSIVVGANPAELARAVIEVWMSLYSPRALAYVQRLGIRLCDLTMGVLLQPFETVEVGGVAFSADPLSLDPRVLMLEAAKGGAQAVVEGKRVDIRLQRSRTEPVDPADPQRSVWEALLQVEALVGAPVDMEWGVRRDGSVVVFQARPIASAAQPELAPGLYPIDAAEVRSTSLALSPRVKRHFIPRRVALRQSARDCGLETPRTYVLWASAEDLVPDLLHEVCDSFRTDRILADVSETLSYVVLDRNEVAERLRADILLPGIRLAVVLGEFIEAELGVVIQPLSEKALLVNVCPGTCGGIARGFLTPNRLVLDSEGTVLERMDHVQDRGFFFDLGERRPILRACSGSCELPASQLRKLARATAALNAALGKQAIVEAESVRGIVYALDCSLPRDSEAGARIEPSVISPGPIRGRVFVMPDTQGAHEVATGWAVNVDSRDPVGECFLTEVMDRLRDFATRFGNEPLVCLARRPTADLAYFLERMSGFVFESGSTLCHLAILLRQERIPAIIREGAQREFSDGDWIELPG